MTQSFEGAVSDNALGDVMAHVLDKGYQAGSLVGTAVVAPVVAYRARTSGSAVTRVLSAVAVSALVGTAGAGVLGAAKIWGQKIDEDGLQDRARKLRRNVGQHRTDVFCKVGSAVGAGAGVLALGPTAPAIFGGAAVGGSLGVLAHVSTFRATQSCVSVYMLQLMSRLPGVEHWLLECPDAFKVLMLLAGNGLLAGRLDSAIKTARIGCVSQQAD